MIYDRSHVQPDVTPGPWYSAATVDRAPREQPGLSRARDTGLSPFPLSDLCTVPTSVPGLGGAALRTPPAHGPGRAGHGPPCCQPL